MCATGREEVAQMADASAAALCADAEVTAHPENFYDRIIEIDLDVLEPYLNGPFTPDAACTISEFAAKVKANGYPQRMEVGLIGSCTNSSDQDLSRAASLARQVKAKGLKMAAQLIINPGSEQVYCTAERDGMMADLEKAFARGEATPDLARFMPNGKPMGTAEFGDKIVSLLVEE